MNGYNPFSKTLVTFTPDTFFGRRTEIEIILEGVCSEIPRSFVLHGNRTVGKSTLISYLSHPQGLIRDYSARIANHIPVNFQRLEFLSIDFYNVTGDQTIVYLWSYLVKNKWIIETLNLPASPDRTISKRDAKTAIQEICQKFSEQHFRLVICIDHFDKAYRTIDLDDEGFLRSLTKFIPFIYVTDKSLPELRSRAQTASPLYNILIPREIGLLSEKDALDVIIKPTQQLQPAFTSEDAQFLADLTGRHPYILVVTCEHVYNLYLEYPDLQSRAWQTDSTREHIVQEILSLPTIQELFAYYWNEVTIEQHTLLVEIAQHKHPKESQRNGINALRKLGLIKINFTAQDEPFIFAPLFQRYILGQKSAERKKTLSGDLGLPNLDQKLLDYLQERTGQVCTFDELLSQVWGDPNATKRSLDAAIHRVRNKLKDVYQDDWDYIENVRGQGFRYVTPR